MNYIVNLKDVNSNDIELVGGKNASIGEMIQNLSSKGIKVPGGFATTILAYKNFLSQNNLDRKIQDLISSLDTTNLKKLNKASLQIRKWILEENFSRDFEKEITQAYAKLDHATVAVRSSAIAEDLENASFAGAHETYLNVKGIKNLLKSIKLVFSSYFTSRAIAYRHDQSFDDVGFALSAGIQPMIRSDKGASGVIFTLDTESGFDKVVLVTGSYGLGEAIVQGKVNPDEFFVYKPTLLENKSAILQRKLGSKAVKMVYANAKDPHGTIKTIPVAQEERLKYCLTDNEIHKLAKQAVIIEKHYGKSMDIEWAKDGITGELYILQARPETVKNQYESKEQVLERYSLQKKGKVLAKGESIGQRVVSGVTRVIANPSQMNTLLPGEILVTDMTDPDWEPIMKRAGGIVTNRGGRTCHAAIIARELGIPAVVGCGDATKKIASNMKVTVSCAEGRQGYVYAGMLDFKIDKTSIMNLPRIPIKLCLNVGNPDIAFQSQFLPNDGVGLARVEFIISNMIGIHPSALLNLDTLPKKMQQEILFKTKAYKNPVEFYIEKLREGISMIAAAFYPKPVIFRFSDFKSNEYANLLGGSYFEPSEENPMIGFRGASRYYDIKFRNCFELECKAFKRVRETMGFTNAHLMVPFVRTVDELQKIIKLMEKFGLKRNDTLRLYMMCEIPSNVLLAADFLQHVDGFSIGSNDLTQLTLGLDRDSSSVSALFDERNPAVKSLLNLAIMECKKQNKYIGICGQGPSDHPDFAAWLMEQGIQAISLNPDTVVESWLRLGKLSENIQEPVSS